MAISFTELIDSGPRWNKVLASDGNTYTLRGNVAWRANNPGNLRPGKLTNGLGAIGIIDTGSNGKFLIFPDAATGARAQEVLQFETPFYANKTIAEAIKRYAPAGDNNDPVAYAQRLADALGVSVDTPLNSLTPEQRATYMQAQRSVENNTPGTIAGEDGASVPPEVVQQFSATPRPPMNIPEVGTQVDAAPPPMPRPRPSGVPGIPLPRPRPDPQAGRMAALGATAGEMSPGALGVTSSLGWANGEPAPTDPFAVSRRSMPAETGSRARATLNLNGAPDPRILALGQPQNQTIAALGMPTPDTVQPFPAPMRYRAPTLDYGLREPVVTMGARKAANAASEASVAARGPGFHLLPTKEQVANGVVSSMSDPALFAKIKDMLRTGDSAIPAFPDGVTYDPKTESFHVTQEFRDAQMAMVPKSFRSVVDNFANTLMEPKRKPDIWLSPSARPPATSQTTMAPMSPPAGATRTIVNPAYVDWEKTYGTGGANQTLQDIHDRREGGVSVAAAPPPPPKTITVADNGASAIPAKAGGFFGALGDMASNGMNFLGDKANELAVAAAPVIENTKEAIIREAIKSPKMRGLVIDPYVAKMFTDKPMGADPATKYGNTPEERQFAAMNRERLQQGLPPLKAPAGIGAATSTVTPNRPSGGGSSDGAGTITGKSSGRKYIVGQTYSNGNGYFIAQADGSFKKLSAAPAVKTQLAVNPPRTQPRTQSSDQRGQAALRASGMLDQFGMIT